VRLNKGGKVQIAFVVAMRGRPKLM